MKNLWKKWSETSLVLRIVCGLVVGAILGFVVPQWTGISILGNVFVGALRELLQFSYFSL